MSAHADRQPWSRRILAVLAAVAMAYAVGRAAFSDPGDQPVAGDEASFVYQALSLAHGDLAFDTSDQERWEALEWSSQPLGLFIQRRDDGWAFAKPVGYSVLLTPAVAAWGTRGVGVVGAMLLAAYAGCWYAAGRLRWDRSTSLVVAAAVTVASQAWFWAFPAHTDLFVAVLVGVIVVASLHAARYGRGIALVVAAAGAGLLPTERLPAIVAVAPLLVVAASRLERRWVLAAAGTGLGVAVLATVPYLYYSDGASWNAYSGERYYVRSVTPWSGGTTENLIRWRTDEVLSASFVGERITHPERDMVGAAVTYAVGRHTGALTFMPAASALVVATVIAAVRRRRRDHDREMRGPPQPAGTERPWGLVAPAAGVGLLGYAAMHVLLFTDNYYGGGQSIGDRYLLQVSAVAAAIPVAGALTRRVALGCAGFAVAWAALVLTPHLQHPDEAFHRLDRTSAVSRLLPFETTQSNGWMFRCEPSECVAPGSTRDRGEEK